MPSDSAPSSTTTAEYQDQPWVRGLFRPALIALLSASAAAGPLVILRSFTLWRLGYVLPLVLVAALEGTYSTIQLDRPQWRNRRGLLFRLAELAVLLLALRMSVWLFSTGLPDPATVVRWLSAPGSFFDPQFVIIGLLLIATWGLAVGVTGDFLALAIQADEYAARQSSLLGESRSQQRAARPTSRSAIVGQFATRWVVGALGLVFCAALTQTRIGLDGVRFYYTVSQLPLPWDILAALLCYFLAGLLLLSEGRLAILRGRWYNDGLLVTPNVLGRWQVNSLLILLAIALLAALLPLGTTSWLANALEFLAGLLIRVAYFLFFALMWLVSMALLPLRMISDTPDVPAERPALPPPIPSQQEAMSRIPPWLGGALLWAALACLLAYLLLTYLSAHSLLRGAWATRWMQLRFWLSSRLARARRVVDAAGATLRARLRPLRARVHLARRVMRPGALPPAERIRYFYLSTLRRAADSGLARPPYKTPSEFGRDLTAQMPDVEIDLEELTEAFLVARYDRQDVPIDKARAIQPVWQRLMRRLRRARQPGPAGSGGDQAKD